MSLSEVEVFCGFILNKRGSQTRRQRDASIKLQEDVERHMTWMVKMLRDDNTADDNLETGSVASGATSSTAQGSSHEHAIELAWACVVVGCARADRAPDKHHVIDGLASFRVLAACCLLKDLEMLEIAAAANAGAGGFVGVGGFRGNGHTMSLPLRRRA